MNDFIKLHPKNYKEVSDKIIFYINEQKVSQNNFEGIFKELRASKRYSVYVGHYVLNFFGSDYLNLQCTSVLYGKKAVEKKDNLYRTKIFTIIPSGGVFVVYNKEIHPSVSDNSWKMEQSVLNNLLDSMGMKTVLMLRKKKSKFQNDLDEILFVLFVIIQTRKTGLNNISRHRAME